MKKQQLHKSFKNALSGLKEIAASERNFQIHLIFAFLVIFFGFYLGITKNEMILLILAITIVLVSEVLNTALELLLDVFFPRAGRNRVADLAAKIIKDMAAGAVLISVAAAMVIGLLIFIPHLLNLK